MLEGYLLRIQIRIVIRGEDEKRRERRAMQGVLGGGSWIVVMVLIL